MKIILKTGEELVLDNIDIEIVSGRIVAIHYSIDEPGAYSQINAIFEKLGIEYVSDNEFMFRISGHGNQNKQ
jgi:hypothetical protein